MERRQILLGSGTALATVLAGCSSDETDSDSSDDEPPAGNNGDGNNGDGNNGDEDNGNDGADSDASDVPGLDRDKLKIDSGKVSIKDVNKDGDKIDIVATTTTTDPEMLAAEVQSLSRSLQKAITDPEAFKAELNSVTWMLKKDGARVMSFYIDVQWAIAYINGEMSEDEFVQTVLDTADETP